MAENEGNDPTQAFQNRLAKYDGDGMKFAATLYDENYQLRSDKRELAKKVPVEGSLVLSKEDAARWEAYQALNLKPEEVAEKVKDTETLSGEVAALKKRDVLRDVATAQGYKLSVLEDRDKASGGLEYTLKDDPKQKRKAAFVKHEGKEIPLEQFAGENWADFMPALKAEQATTTRGSADGATRGADGTVTITPGLGRLQNAYAEASTGR